MFYLNTSQMDETLRFGDIIQGFPLCFSVIDTPSHQAGFNIRVSAPTFAVVLSPCCSISDKVLAIAPLEQLENKLFSNPYLAEEPTRINTKVAPEKTVPPIHWANMQPEKKANMAAMGDGYIFVDKFVYAPSDLFPEYTINRKEGNIKTRYYVVDFRASNKISCDSIKNPQYSPGACKVLQLSVETRELMRRKIASFYRRMPEEDAAILAS